MTSGQSELDGRRLIVLAEGSNRIGLGHLMRMLALGQAWSDAGGQVEALLGEAPGALLDRYRHEGFRVRLAAEDASGHADALRGLLADDRAAVSAIDLPDLSVSALEALGEAADRTLVVDDMALLADYPVALVLNQNAHADPGQYPSTRRDRLLVGLRWVLLRREFQQAMPRRSIPSRARNLLVTFGGGDPTGMTGRTLEALVKLPEPVRSEVRVRVIVGTANAVADRVAAAAGTAPFSATVERGVDDMVDPMTWADLTVTSGGSTVWELARIGCPAIVIATAPAERSLAVGLEAEGLFDSLGSAEALDADGLASAIGSRLDDHDWREAMARLGPVLVDGQGARRVVAALSALRAP